MKSVILLALFAGCQAYLIPGRCLSNSCENGAICSQATQTHFFCQCDSLHCGLRCELQRHGSSCRSDAYCSADNNPCENGGNCANTDSGFICSCPLGWTGARCETRVACATDAFSPHACRNNAYCDVQGRCVCPVGWSGERCERDVNECEGSPCENDGLCMNGNGTFTCFCLEGFEGPRCETNTDDCGAHQCAEGAKCIDGVDSYTCQCPEGKGGLYCNQTLACSLPEACLNGYCIDTEGGAKCLCDSGWTGDRCDEDIDECLNSICEAGSTCFNRNGSFECVCPEGRSGLRCEYDSSKCTSDRECLNGGRCSLDGYCSCPPEFDGPNCEEKYRNPCLDNACGGNRICVSNRSEIRGFSCVCQSGFGGRLCETPLNHPYSKADKIDLAKCSLRGCAALARDGVCDQECNHFACGFDGGDCSAGTAPFARCADASFCAHRFGDGHCDEYCNNENCLFDGSDCAGAAPVPRHNGTMTDITLVLLVTPQTFVRKVDDLLSSLSERLRTSVKIKKSLGAMEVYEWSSASERGKRVEFGSRTDARVEYGSRGRRAILTAATPPLTGVLVVIQVDLAECSTQCWSDANAVALFIGAMEANKGPEDRDMVIHSSAVILDPKKNGENEEPVSLLVVVALVGLVLAALAMVVVGVKRRLIIDAPIWTPPCKEAIKESTYYHANSHLAFNNGYHQGFLNYGDASSKLPQPVFKPAPTPVEMPASSALELAAAGDERVTHEMRSLANHTGRFDRTPFHWLALNSSKKNADIISDCNLLISFGVDVNKQDIDGETALHYACRNGRVTLAKMLLDAGADPMIDNELDMTPLHDAAKHFDDDCIALLISHAVYKDTSKFDVVDVEDRTALMLYAANSCHSIRGAELLHKAGADVNYAGDKKRSHRYRGRTALHHAAQSNKDNRKMIEFLVAKNANKDAQDNEEATALWLAVNSCNLTAVDELLKAGASLDFADHKERTPEVLAMEKGYMDISKRLHIARQRCPTIGMLPASFPMFSQRSTPITAPRIIKKPTTTTKKSPTTTPSPAGLKATGPSCLDSPNSDHHGGRQSAGAANSSSEMGSPAYTPAYTLAPPSQPAAAPSGMRPSPPYDSMDPAAFGAGSANYFPSMSLPPLSLNQPPACAFATDPYPVYHQYHHHAQYPTYQQPPACEFRDT